MRFGLVMPRLRFLGPLDILVVFGIGAGAALAWVAGPQAHGSRATAYVEGEAVAWWTLDGAPANDTVVGALGPVAIEHGNGAVRIMASPCPNRVCLRQGRVSRLHDQLVCVPSHLVIVVEDVGNRRDGDLDAVH